MLLPPTVVVVAVMMVAKIVYIMKRNNMSFFRKKKKHSHSLFYIPTFPIGMKLCFIFITIPTPFSFILHSFQSNTCKVGIKLSSPFPPFHSCYQHHHDVESKYKNVRLREKEKKTDKKNWESGI
jgi:hypothetical protein